MELLAGNAFEVNLDWAGTLDEESKLWIGYNDARNYVILGDPLAGLVPDVINPPNRVGI